MTIHGLWPQFKDPAKRFPAFCKPSDGYSDAVALEVAKTLPLSQAWPELKANQIWKHEWEKHGTCSGLSQKDYMIATLDLARAHNEVKFIAQNAGKQVELKDLQGAFDQLYGNGQYALICNSADFLTEVRSCWSMVGTTNKPGSATTCGTGVLSAKTVCKANKINLSAGFVIPKTK